MTYRSPPKRDLSPDSPESRQPGPNTGVHGSRLEIQGSRFAVNCSPLTAHCSPSPVHRSRSNETGFTLIEVIAALVIISVLATMVFSTTGDGLWRTARGVGECRILFELQGEMEKIVRDYKSRLITEGGTIDLADFRTAVMGYTYVDAGNTDYLTESGGNLNLTATQTRLLLVTLAQGDQRISSIFSQ